MANTYRRHAPFYLALAALLLLSEAAAAETMSRIRDNGVIRIGHRADALPHSYVNAAGQPAGYIVDLCRGIAASIRQHLAPAPVRVEFIQVTAQDRFDALGDNRIDLLCEPTSITMARRQIVDFSIPTFIDGAGVAYRNKQISSFEDFAGRRIGVLDGTTTHDLLRESLSQLNLKADIVVVSDHRSGFRLLAAAKLDAYFADRAMLAYLSNRFESDPNIQIGKNYFSHETYALALQRGDAEFRWIVDRALARLARDGTMNAIANKNFGVAGDDLFNALTAINSIPD